MTDSVVYVVDDDQSVRASLESLLASEGHAVLTFDSAQAFLEAPRPPLPACLVLDVRLRGVSGLEFQRELARNGILTPIVFITGHGDVPMSVAAMKAGAIEFLMKPFRDQDLLDAVHNGIDMDRRRLAQDRQITELRDRYALMTPREREIMPLVASGLMNKQIAMDLKLSEVTVKVHRAQIMTKMQARTLPDLVRIVDRLATDPAKA
ncbi:MULTISPECIES: response regulator [unclassified Chelatococcus]|uniref:response regulator transcription factor n=1 Tax=unclassified Chelatococcus TaxID=2638111 RepID=UPI001BCCA500|nr:MULTISPECIES: response regulator [unclassified Chelatococcus]CAH1658829.1 Nodulation protein W [Hyphomicrobiales bacterium]MBS7740852.1 response regulator transcription factor [Chelatococcus sp. HY11]MBX3545914.1 response regulator transcription factor [Chelatococcus sp.]MCO5079539.1 response regulator [Chelatococcus sp.]CAH1684020.1 Nodulation protein W [Hyphomicrobiales bacterium]